MIPCHLADRYRLIWWPNASIIKVIFEPYSSKMFVSIYKRTQHHIRRDQRIHYNRGSNFLRTSEVPSSTSWGLVSSIQEHFVFFLLSDCVDNWKYNWWWKCNEYHISMLLANYGTVIQLQVLKKIEKRIHVIFIIFSYTQEPVWCLFVFGLLAFLLVSLFTLTIWQTTLIIIWFQRSTWYHMHIPLFLVHKSQCTVTDRENLDLMENNEIRAAVEFSSVITAECQYYRVVHYF